MPPFVMVTPYTKEQSKQRANTCDISIVVCTLVTISAVHSGMAQVVDAYTDKIRRAKEIVVIDVRHGIESEVGRDPIVDVCQSFRMSPRQVERFLRLDKSITVGEFDHAWDWLPF